MSIGDITSTAKGSGARFNDGKAAVELIPLSFIAATYRGAVGEQLDPVVWALDAAGRFQVTGDVQHLLRAMGYLSPHWLDCARVFEFGRRKYTAWNWSRGMAWSVPLGCIGRHSLKILADNELIDVESGRHHAGHILCNLVMLTAYTKTYPEGNDLPVRWLREIAG